MSENSFSAKAIRAGYESSEHFNSVVPPIYQTASFDLHDIDRTRRLWTGAEDIVEAVKYIASDKARYMTGNQFVLDAGLLTR